MVSRLLLLARGTLELQSADLLFERGDLLLHLLPLFLVTARLSCVFFHNVAASDADA